MAEQTKKRSSTTDHETETEVRAKNTPAITDYATKRQRNKNLQDHNFNCSDMSLSLSALCIVSLIEPLYILFSMYKTLLFLQTLHTKNHLFVFLNGLSCF